MKIEIRADGQVVKSIQLKGARLPIVLGDESQIAVAPDFIGAVAPSDKGCKVTTRVGFVKNVDWPFARVLEVLGLSAVQTAVDEVREESEASTDG